MTRDAPITPLLCQKKPLPSEAVTYRRYRRLCYNLDMYTGIIIGQSLIDVSILENLNVLNSWTEGNWTLYKVSVTEEEIEIVQRNLAEGTWYTHFWKEDKDSVMVLFREASFQIKCSDENTWLEAIS